MSLADQARKVYNTRLKTQLESTHRDQFVAIEPISESYYIGNKFVDAAKNAYPDRMSFVIRIGHDAAIDLGNLWSLTPPAGLPGRSDV